MHAATKRLIPLAILVAVTSWACSRGAPTFERSEADESLARAVAPEAAPMDMAATSNAIAGSAKMAAQSSNDAAALPASSASQGNASNPSMIIRTGSASVEVDSLELAIAAVQRIAAAVGGWVGNTSLATGDYEVRRATIELKVPSARYDEALAGLKPIGKVESVSSNAEDVGEEFVDLSARTANARRLEERLITLLATRTGKLEDVLSVERELARVREEIERYEGRLRYLRTRVATSTLTVTVHEHAPLVSPNPGQNVITEAFRDAWRNFVHFLAAFIASLGTIVPVLVLVGVGMLAWNRFGRPRWTARVATSAAEKA